MLSTVLEHISVTVAVAQIFIQSGSRLQVKDALINVIYSPGWGAIGHPGLKAQVNVLGDT